MDVSKPDLIIHPLYAKSIIELSNYDLHSFFNVIDLNDDLQKEDVCPIFITDYRAYQLQTVTLKPYYTESVKPVKRKSGMRPDETTCCFTEEVKMFRYVQNGPRYVIWPEKLPLAVCATYVDRVTDYNLYQACDRAKSWASANQVTHLETVIVFDLDETLIDRKGKVHKFANDVLEHARYAYDKVVLYSHGSHLYVDDLVQNFDKGPDTFDLILANDDDETTTCKNLLSLYNYFPNVRFRKATLVDDLIANWTPEYTDAIILKVKRSLKHLLRFICDTKK